MSLLHWVWSSIPDIETVEPYATTLAALAIVGLAVQLSLQKRSVNADEARLARESALFLYEAFGKDDFRTGRRVLGAKAAQAHKNMSEETKASIKEVLHRYGLVSLAFVNGGIKGEVINSYRGSVLLKDWERLEAFVTEERKQNHLLYQNTEKMVETIASMRRT